MASDPVDIRAEGKSFSEAARTALDLSFPERAGREQRPTWVVRVIQMNAPTEYCVGPFEDVEAASAWTDRERQPTWMGVSIMPLYAS